TQRGSLEGTWYEAIATSLRSASETAIDGDGRETLTYPRERPLPATLETAEVATTPTPAALVLPPLPRVPIVPVVRPSAAGRDADLSRVLETVAESTLVMEEARDADSARREGIALHALLQHLPRVEHRQWP